MKTRFKYFLLAIILIGNICEGIAMGITIEDIQKITKGKGVFSVTVNNKENYKISVPVVVELRSPPEGYDIVPFTETIHIAPNSSMIVLLPRPFVSRSPYYEDIVEYESDGPELPESAEIVVYVGRGFLPRLQQIFHAEYIPRTRIIEVPDVVFNVTEDINEIHLNETCVCKK